VIVGEGWEAVKECSDSIVGSCRRITLTCSDPFAVAAPKTRLQALPLRQGPMRHHPHRESPPGEKREQDRSCLRTAGAPVALLRGSRRRITRRARPSHPP